MSTPVREIVINVRPGCMAEFSAAFERWQNTEKLVRGVQIFAAQVKAWLLPVWVVDGPKMGTWHDDRQRALSMFRTFVPAEFVESVTFEGEDWRVG